MKKKSDVAAPAVASGSSAGRRAAVVSQTLKFRKPEGPGPASEWSATATAASRSDAVGSDLRTRPGAAASGGGNASGRTASRPATAGAVRTEMFP